VPARKFVHASSIVKGISEHYGVIFAVEREENYCVTQVEKLITVYHKTDVLDLQNLLRDKFGKCKNNASYVEI
jgi:hypothetical protein